MLDLNCFELDWTLFDWQAGGVQIEFDGTRLDQTTDEKDRFNNLQRKTDTGLIYSVTAVTNVITKL